jgi:hypothetical protein
MGDKGVKFVLKVLQDLFTEAHIVEQGLELSVGVQNPGSQDPAVDEAHLLGSHLPHLLHVENDEDLAQIGA